MKRKRTKEQSQAIGRQIRDGITYMRYVELRDRMDRIAKLIARVEEDVEPLKMPMPRRRRRDREMPPKAA